MAPDPISDPLNPLIVQADRSVFLEAFNPRADAARAVLAPFAELVSSPEHLHTYRITPLSLWNAASAGLDAETMLAALGSHAKFPVPGNVATDVRELVGRWGRLRLEQADSALLLIAAPGDEALLSELARHKGVAPLLGERMAPTLYTVAPGARGELKRALMDAGWPVDDRAGYTEGAALAVTLAPGLRVRDYQQEAAQAFYQAGSERGGSGVIVLAPGSGKTVVGLLAMHLVGQRTLVLTTNRTSVNQWRRELLAKTGLLPEDVREYGPGTPGRRGASRSGSTLDLAPVTLCTYQMLTYRRVGRGGDGGADLADRSPADRSSDGSNSADGGTETPSPETSGQDEHPHMALIGAEEWGLIIYDEVHLLPAPVFRLTAGVQARRRLGLTATLVREDGREGDVFALIGPKRYDQPWKTLEAQGWIAPATCAEVRLRLDAAERSAYAVAPDREKHRLAATNPAKRRVLAALLARHPGAPTLVIGQFLDQLELMAADLEAPLITGKTPQSEREALFQAFREGRLGLLLLSKVGNFALDLPGAEVLVQVSGAFGSRQEEAQRLGRLLRPKGDGRAAHFYSLVTRETVEEDYAHHRQLFLAEQGYAYDILDEAELEVPA